MQAPLTIELPWPPSDNALTRHAAMPVKGTRKYRAIAYPSEEAKEYQKAVGQVLYKKNLPRLSGPLRMDVELYPPDHRHIDGPNRWKALMDSLKRRTIGRTPKGQSPRWDPHQLAWLFATDDSQVVEWGGKLRHVIPGGKAVVTLTPLPGGLEQTELFRDDADEMDESLHPMPLKRTELPPGRDETCCAVLGATKDIKLDECPAPM